MHRDYSEGWDYSVAESLRRHRRTVLEGTELVFSGGLVSGQIERHHLWQMGEGYGARCERHFTEGVTHVVSGHPNSNTVRRARAEGKHAVSVDWLEECSHRWVRQKEDLYVLHEPQQHVPPEDCLRRAAEEASRASHPEEVMRRALDAIALIPASLPHSDRLKAAIRFIVPTHKRPRVEELFDSFESNVAGGHGASLNEVMSEITQLVGETFLKQVMQELGLT